MNCCGAVEPIKGGAEGSFETSIQQIGPVTLSHRLSTSLGSRPNCQHITIHEVFILGMFPSSPADGWDHSLDQLKSLVKGAMWSGGLVACGESLHKVRSVVHLL